MGTGSSLVEDDYVDTAKKVLEVASSKGCKIILPSDVVLADKFAPDAETKVTSASEIPGGGWALITVRRLPRRSRPNSLNARPSSGTDPWVSSNSMPLPRAPSTLPIPLQNSPARVLALSSAVVTPSLLSRRRASLKRCPMSLLAAVLPLSFLRARSSLVLLLWTSFKRTASWLPLCRHRAATAKKTNHRPGGVSQLPTPVTSRLPGNWYGYSAFT